MRLSTWLFISLLYLRLPAYCLQPEPKVSITGTYTIQRIFQKIEQQTGKRIFYANNILNDQQKIHLKVVNSSISEVLSQILTGKKLEWSIEQKFITIVAIKNQPTTTPADTTISVTGRVTNEKGDPIIGATVVVKGTGNGANAGIDGVFTIQHVRPNAYLVVSSVQYVTKEITVKGKSVIGDVRLAEYVGNLDETVIIAYGTTSRRLSTGNINSVKAIDIEKQPVSNPLLALSGRVPGLTITQTSGFAGSGVIVRIQGQNSISRGNDPFYVVDGVPFNPQVLPTISIVLGESGNNGIGAVQGSGNPLSYINPADIESIEILKDADATAIYGSRAANGAILITTKKGKPGQTSVDITMQSGIGRVTRKMDLLNTKEYLQMRREAKANDNAAISEYDYDINGTWDTTANTDWQKKLIGNNAHYTDLQASISGGSALTTFRANGGYHRETTVFPGSFADTKGSFGMNINHVSFNQRFRMQISGNFLSDNNQLPVTDLTSKALQLAPNAPALYMPDGTPNWASIPSGSDNISTWTNPIADNMYSINQNKTNNLIANTNITYAIIPGLDIKTSLGYNNLNNTQLLTLPLTIYKPEDRIYLNRQAIYSKGSINSWIIEPQINYNRSFNKLKLDILAGTTFQQKNTEQERLEGAGYSSDLVLGDIKAASNITVPFDGTIESVYKYNAVFGRLNLNWGEKYIVNISGRRDGSSRFGLESQFHDFAAIGAAWVFSNENFIQSSLPFISFGKLRASYGTTGNDQIGDYQFISKFQILRVDNPYQGSNGLIPEGHSNPYLQWELTKKLQVGIDAGLIDDHILLSASYYRNRSSNQLLGFNLPIFTGFNGVFRNFPATVQNNGWEFSINTKNIKRNGFQWNTNFNITIPKNTLIDFPTLATSSYNNSLIIGQPLNIKKLYSFAGVNTQTGAYQFYAADGTIANSLDDIKDRTVILNINQRIYGGLQNTFTYKSFQLDLLFQFVKQSAPNYNLGIFPGAAGTNQPKSVLQRWQKDGDIRPIQRYNADFSVFSEYLNAASSNAAFSDASYIRLKNLYISWQIPDKLKEQAHFQNCKIFIQGQNLLTMTRYEGMDPENTSLISLPPLKIWTLGLQLGF